MDNKEEEIKKNTLDDSVLKSIITCSCGLIMAGAAVCFLFRHQLPDKFMQGFLTGSLGGLANLYFLSLVITSTFTPSKVRKGRALIGLAGINASLFAIVYPVYKQMVDGIGLLAGFTLTLAIMLIGAYWLVNRKGNG